MTDHIFVDSDIVLDLLCKRQPFYPFSAEIFTLGDTKKITLFTTPLVFANMFYILRKTLGTAPAKELLRKLRMILNIIPIEARTVDLALNSDFSDFEDGLQYFAARTEKIPLLLTRNIKDYKIKGIIVQTPEEYLKFLPK